MLTCGRCLELDRLAEFTVEAGRPDTITADKMAVLRDLGVDRVSVNPQTMQDEVLRAMGRSHTAADILTAYDIVRKSGIPIVNMDLIAGLPKDSVAGFRNTLDTVLSLDPENITVHTLALKKGARLMMEREGLPTGEETSAMLDYAWDALRAAGQIPYYLYRQKYMSGALENIGWCKPGTEGLYNICIMEELHSISGSGRRRLDQADQSRHRQGGAASPIPNIPTSVHGTHGPALPGQGGTGGLPAGFAVSEHGERLVWRISGWLSNRLNEAIRFGSLHTGDVSGGMRTPNFRRKVDRGGG